jgi:hypothetical protein
MGTNTKTIHPASVTGKPVFQKGSIIGYHLKCHCDKKRKKEKLVEITTDYIFRIRPGTGV